MSVSYSPTQTALFFATLVEPSSAPVLNTDAAGLFRFQLPTNLYFVETLTLTVTFTGSMSFASESFDVLLLADPTALTSLVYGNISISLCPQPAYLFGTASYHRLGGTTVTSYTTTTINLDLAKVTQVITTSTHPTTAWTGSLLLWVVPLQDSASGGLSTTATLTAANIVEYTNRDTGSRSDNPSRLERCPVTGLRARRGEMVRDGYRDILVHPTAYDPPEPEPLDWDTYPEDNEET